MVCKLSYRFVFASLLLFLVNGLPLLAAEIKDSACLDCHADKDLYKTNAAGRAVSLFVDTALLKASPHKTNSCAGCHTDITDKHPDDEIPAKPVDCAGCHKDQSESYGASVHGLALANGQLNSAGCTDCHGTHNVLPPTAPQSPLHYSRLAHTCGGCHDQAARDVEASVHGIAVAKGVREAPTCTDCHSEHKIQGLKQSSHDRSSAELCSNCHASERLNTKFKLPADRVKTFFESYHGLASQYGSTVAANCGSCHGFHNILASTNPQSTIHPSRLIETCGKCHAGATTNFVSSKIHIDAATSSSDGVGGLVNWWVRRIYLILIFATIGFMLVHNLLLFGRKLAAHHKNLHFTVLRMDKSQRVQHLILAASFIILAITGFALKFPDSWISHLLGSSEPLRRWSHRISGLILLAAGVYHLLYLALSPRGRGLFRDLWPVKKDVADFAQNAKYLAGSTPERPRFARFGYAEKMEYWAVVWGTVIMGVTGFMLWFALDVTRFLPRWTVDVATTIHYYEAILACLAIVVWHFYHVIFDPDVYPLNTACWNGRVSEEWMHEEHPLDPSARAEQPGTSKATAPDSQAR